MLVSSVVFVSTGVFTEVEASSKDVLKDVSHPRLCDASEKYNIIHKAILFLNIFVKLLEKRKLI